MLLSLSALYAIELSAFSITAMTWVNMVVALTSSALCSSSSRLTFVYSTRNATNPLFLFNCQWLPFIVRLWSRSSLSSVQRVKTEESALYSSLSSSTFDNSTRIDDQSNNSCQFPMTSTVRLRSRSSLSFVARQDGGVSDLHWRCSVVDGVTPALDGAASGRLTRRVVATISNSAADGA